VEEENFGGGVGGMFDARDEERHWGCRISHHMTWHSYSAMILQNELIQIVLLPGKGSEIVQFLFKPLDVDFMWHGPNRLRDRGGFVPAGGSQASTFFDFWSGGWFEVVPNGGPACEYTGAPLGNFAETINLPWEYTILENKPNLVTVGLWTRTYRTPFLLQKTLTLRAGCPTLWIEERLTNVGNESVNYMWGHHPVVGEPFLDETCRLYAPDCAVEVLHAEDGPDNRMGLHQVGRWPFIKDREGNQLDLRGMPPRSARTMDNCYLRDFEEGWIAVQNPKKRVGFGLAWDPDVFRYVWVWQALGGGIGYPWYRRTYNMGLEPWTSYPCAGVEQAVKRGTAPMMAPGGHRDAWLTATVFVGAEEPRAVHRDGCVSLS
jgi:hypothetical protein